MKYGPIDNDHDSQSSEDCEAKDTFLPDIHTPEEYCMSRGMAIFSKFWTPLLSLFLLGVGVWIGRTSVDPSENCPSHVQKYSTILKEVDTNIYPVLFNGSFVKMTPFRMDAGPEVDAAWKSLGTDYNVVIVPPEEAKKSGLVKPGQVRVAEKYGGGYPAYVEGLHHLHCLNLLRKATWFNYNYYIKNKEGPFLDEENGLKFHVTHCLDTLRQQLMCQTNTGFLGQVWWDKKAPKAFGDFTTEHKCKNFEAIRQWAEDQQLRYLLEDNVPIDFLEAPDVNIVAAEMP